MKAPNVGSLPIIIGMLRIGIEILPARYEQKHHLKKHEERRDKAEKHDTMM